MSFNFVFSHSMLCGSSSIKTGFVEDICSIKDFLPTSSLFALFMILLSHTKALEVIIITCNSVHSQKCVILFIFELSYSK